MYITYSDYSDMGYSIVSEEAFPRYEAKAESIVRRYTFGRITDDNITDTNKRGVCEIIDILYSSDNNVFSEGGVPIKSFSNEGYSETYASEQEVQDASVIKSSEALGTFFTREQLYRGV